MTDLLTNEKAITTGASVAKPGHRANQILAIAVAVTVAIAAAIVAINMSTDGGLTPSERAIGANQLRWEGLAATSSAVNAPAAQLASQLRWEGLAATSSAVNAPAAQLASQLRWEGLAAQAQTSSDRGVVAEVARLEGLADYYRTR